MQYPEFDFHFWVKYGSWANCAACGSFYLDDKHFITSVYQDQVTSATPDLLAAHRRQVPTDSMVHAHGSIGVSS